MKREKFDQILADYIEQEKDYIKEHNEIKEILLPLVGKPINGQTLNKKRLGKFRLDLRYGLIHIEGKYSHLIGYPNNENLIAVEKTDYSRGFEYFDACHGWAAQERIEKVEKSNKDIAFEIFNSIEYHYNELRKLFGRIDAEGFDSYDFPPYYDILRSIHSDDKYLKLTDFYYIREMAKEL